MSNEINDEKTKLKHVVEYIENFGCDIDDIIEKLEDEAKILLTILPFISNIAKNYDDAIENLNQNIISGNLTQNEYKISKDIADKIGLSNKKKNEELIQKLNVINIKISSYKEIVTKLKQDFDTKNNRIKSLNVFEETQKAVEENKANEKQLLIRRPLGVHPGNPLAARRAQSIVSEEIVDKQENKQEEPAKTEEIKVKKLPGRKKKE